MIIRVLDKSVDSRNWDNRFFNYLFQSSKSLSDQRNVSFGPAVRIPVQDASPARTDLELGTYFKATYYLRITCSLFYRWTRAQTTQWRRNRRRKQGSCGVNWVHDICPLLVSVGSIPRLTLVPFKFTSGVVWNPMAMVICISSMESW